MLSQTAEAPFAGAKFTMAELDQISAQMTKLVAMTSKSQGAQAAAGVWDHFIGDRLKTYVEAGCHERPDEPCSAFEESVEDGENGGDTDQ